MSAPVCPTCRTVHPQKSAAPGTKLVCDSCMEEFVAGGSKTADPGLLSPDDEPAPATAAPVRARPAKASPPAVGTGRVKGAPKTPPKAKRRDDDDDHDPDEPRRPRRQVKPDGSKAVIFAVLGLGLVLLLVCVGIGAWLFSRASAAREEQETARNNALARQREFNPPAPNANPFPVAPPMQPVPPDNVPPVPPDDGQPLPPNDPVRPVEPVEPARPPVRAAPGLAAFTEPANRYKAGTQTKLRELTSVKLPALPAPPKNDPRVGDAISYGQVIHSPRHQLLFVRNVVGVWVYDLKTEKVVGTRAPKNGFTDMSLAPDQSALFVADYGGENTGYGTPLKPSHVHRFDLAARTWEDRKAPKIAWKIEATESHRVLLLEQDQWVDVSLNWWETDGVGLRELARTGSDYNGDIEYDPRTGRIYHGNRGISSPRISVRAVDGDKVKPIRDTGSYGSASEGGGGGSVVLSQDGTRLYYGALQVDPKDVGKNLHKFPEVIYAASRDVAFGGRAYYRAATGSKLGEFPFKAMGGDPRDRWSGSPPALSISPDGMSVWVIDRDKNVARQFAIEGDE